MFGVTTSDDYKPVTWMGRVPVDVTTILVGIHVAVAIITAFLFRFGPLGFLDHFMFDSSAVLRGEVWRVVTYAFIHSPNNLIWFAIEMYMLFVFGREVERFIGQRSFIVLYLSLLLTPPLFLTLWGLGQRSGLAGSPILHFGVFIAFAAIYPSAEMFLRITAKWTALILAAVYSLTMLAGQPWYELVVLWLTIATAFLFIRLQGVGPELVWWENFKARLQPKPKFKVVPRPEAPRRTDDDLYESVDPILEKIAKSGIGSLTANERRQLDRARNRLLNESK
jgi:membrane associated rhomboid family serine protease